MLYEREMMGLSASQARLLSITQRINNNELQSEIIANAKIQLSARNTLASEKYINSLDATKLEYISYNDTGIKENVALTFNAVNQYTPLKNQYALFNNENQIYVSETDAANFEDSNNLYEFLDKYGLFDEGRNEFQAQLDAYNKQMEEFDKKQDEYDKALAEFNKQFDDYSAALEEYNQKLAEYTEKQEQYEKDYQEYLDRLNAPKLYNDFTNAVVGNSHYNAAKNNDPGCFLHVLNKLIDYNGQNLPYNTSATDASGNNIQLTSLFEVGYYSMPELQPISDAMWGENEDLYVCDGHDVGTDGTKNLLEIARESGRAPSTYEILSSDFIEVDNGDGTYSYNLKTLKQKAVDMYYIIANSSEQLSTRGSGTGEFTITNDGVTVSAFLTDFVEGDMKGLDPKEPEEPTPPDAFNEEMPTLDVAAPQKPEKPEYTDKIYDKPLAQWYTNLWNLMDGNTLSDEIYSIYDDQADFDYFTVGNKPKSSTKDNNNYVVMPNDQAGNAEWLQFAINNGLVTLSQAALRNNTNGSDITWERVESSSTSDIYESQDETKIAKAEAEYKMTLAEIQAEDKQFDIKMKKLDTEHSALEKELESIKGVMDKNVERSYSAFS